MRMSGRIAALDPKPQAMEPARVDDTRRAERPAHNRRRQNVTT